MKIKRGPDKGKEVTMKEAWFRFKEGIKQMTPLQQTKIALNSNYLIIIGIIWGLIVEIHAHAWWLTLIFLGSLPLVLLSHLGYYRKLKAFREMEEVKRQAEELLNFKEVKDDEKQKG